MLRILLAAVASGIALQMWVLGSSVWLPHCAPAVPTPPLPAAPADVELPPAPSAPIAEFPPEPTAPPVPISLPDSPFILVDDATPVISDSLPEQAALPPLPDRSNRAPILPPLVIPAFWQNVGLAFFVGLIAALMAAALPEATTLRHQCTLILLMGVFAALIGRFSDMANPDESRAELLACLANQFCGIVLVAAVAFAIARCRWLEPKFHSFYSRTS